MNRNFIALLFLFSSYFLNAQHSNEFYIDGAHVTVSSGITLHIQGDFHLDEGPSAEKGRLNNDGVVELRGNFYLESDNTEQVNGTAPTLPGTSLGVVRFKNRNFLVETTHQFENQTIISTGTLGLINQRAFYNLEVGNDNNTLASVLDNFVDVNGGDVEVINTLNFITDNRIRTNNVGSFTGTDYDYKLIINNTDPSSIVNSSTTAGDNKRYVEGKLSHKIIGPNTYYFPIGLEPGFAGADGMEAFQLVISNATTQFIDSYLLVGETDLGVPQIYCDVGDYDNLLSGNQSWATCVGGPDGIYDFSYLNLKQTHEWLIQNSGDDFTYDIRVFPGPGQDLANASGQCGGDFYHLLFLSKDGALYEGESIAPIITPPSPFNPNTFPIGFNVCPPSIRIDGLQLLGLSDLSRFRLYGADFGQTLLPIELASIQAKPVRDYIQVYWKTLSEFNNKGFEVWRSEDAINYEYVDWISGRNKPSFYYFNDHEVKKGVNYYYKLRQVDYNDEYKWSPIVYARVLLDAPSISIYPNPSINDNIILEVNLLEQSEVNIRILNIIGQEVITIQTIFKSGLTQYELPTKDLNKGTYLIILDDNNPKILIKN